MLARLSRLSTKTPSLQLLPNPRAGRCNKNLGKSTNNFHPSRHAGFAALRSTSSKPVLNADLNAPFLKEVTSMGEHARQLQSRVANASCRPRTRNQMAIPALWAPRLHPLQLLKCERICGVHGKHHLRDRKVIVADHPPPGPLADLGTFEVLLHCVQSTLAGTRHLRSWVGCLAHPHTRNLDLLELLATVMSPCWRPWMLLCGLEASGDIGDQARDACCFHRIPSHQWRECSPPLLASKWSDDQWCDWTLQVSLGSTGCGATGWTGTTARNSFNRF